MQTASRIAVELGVEDIKISYRFAEWQSEFHFDTPPIPSLKLNQLGLSGINELLNDDLRSDGVILKIAENEDF